MTQKTQDKKATQTKLKEFSRVSAFISESDKHIDPVLRRQQVEAITGLTTSALYRLVKLGDFPKPVQITSGTVGWKYSEIFVWLESRPRVASF